MATSRDPLAKAPFLLFAHVRDTKQYAVFDEEGSDTFGKGLYVPLDAVTTDGTPIAGQEFLALPLVAASAIDARRPNRVKTVQRQNTGGYYRRGQRRAA